MAAAADAALRAARMQVLAVAQNLITTQLGTFDERLGARAWKQYREAFMREVTSGGTDFVATARFAGNIPPPAAYDDALILSDEPRAAPTETLPQLRQRALLHLLKSGLQPGGDSLRIIEGCVYASGRLGAPGGPAGEPQALLLLDMRWASAAEETEEVTAAAANLRERKWPARLSVDVFNEYFNAVVSDATAVAQNPVDDSDTSVTLRQSWWAKIATPPTGSVYYAAAARARVVTQQRRRTVADRDAFRTAMLAEIGSEAPASATAGGGGGLARPAVAGARVAELDYSGMPGLMYAPLYAPAHVHYADTESAGRDDLVGMVHLLRAEAAATRAGPQPSVDSRP